MEGALFADFTKAHPDITVELVGGAAGWGAAEEKLKASLAAGAPINVYQNGGWAWYDVQSALIDFTGLLARDHLDPLKIFMAQTVSAYTIQGKLGGLALVGISQDALAYNQDLFDTAGLAHPPLDPNDASWTMEKFLEYAEKLTQPDKLVFGFGGTVSGDGNIGGITGGTYFGQGPWDDKTQKAQMDQPGAIQGLQFFKDLRDKYKVQPNSDQVKSIGAKGNIFTSGKIGMQVIYGYIPKQTFRWAIGALPHTGSQNVSGRQHAQALQATKTARSEQTWTLMKWLMVPANAARFPLSAQYAVSPVLDASDLAAKTFQQDVGVDPQAFSLMAQHSREPGWGMRNYPGWDTVLNWLTSNFPNFDQGKQSATDYGRTATDYINANLLKS